MQTFSLTLPFPPSVNHIWVKRASGVYLAKKAREYRTLVGTEILVARSKGLIPKKPLAETVTIQTVFYPPDKRVRDLDNYNKALWDALTHSGFWLDDRQVTRFSCEWDETEKRSAKASRVELKITVQEDDNGKR